MIEEKKTRFGKIVNRIINFFKNPREVISFFLPIIIAFILLIPLPYYVKLGGGTIELNNKIEVNEKGHNGYFGALYVRESKANIVTYLLTYIVPSFDREKIENVTINEEDTNNYNYREKLYFTSSAQAATKVAFEKAGRKVNVSSSKFIVIYVDKDSKTSLKVGDEIKKINDIDVSTYDEMLSLINKATNSVNITVKREGKIIDTVNHFMEINKEKKLGIVISNEIKYSSNPKVDLKFNGREAGPSGGLMIALTIYDKLIPSDITKGRTVVGTGTIDVDGNVGEIGGIKYKLMAAKNKKADIVFVPLANYSEAKSIALKKGYKFELVPVKTFDDAVNYLKK